ncbi:2-amino-4-hydroxy-6-hydroxymethyldihydropteridine diphosphokinase [Albibacillus kandeliae]|uniref:2-amino-4-hydroxy-6- hydroxymethyldihydropteridine diphosphokinase n=1 Tax=Albibacillus kandeliae TaxID=2174228 RepID=UPI000D69123F|nr:2-amino-4-hydroxy-6-hydroxymethyldihydropteridine diphosphokinase [Albibacillus kandeliae]
MDEFGSKSLIALGSNQKLPGSDPAEILREAIVTMARGGLVIRAVSRFFATPCFPAGAGPDYVNAAVLATGGDSPGAVLDLLHEIEAGAGRERVQRWGMRTLDLDLLDFDGRVLPDAETHALWRDLPLEEQMRRAPEQLILPHPRIQDRAFVLVPVMDICPDWVHPLLNLTVSEMLAALPPGEIDAVRPL